MLIFSTRLIQDICLLKAERNIIVFEFCASSFSRTGLLHVGISDNEHARTSQASRGGEVCITHKTEEIFSRYSPLSSSLREKRRTYIIDPLLDP